MRRYHEVLSCFDTIPIVYIDETGIDTYLYRKRGRAPRGVKVYDKISGRRFERTSVVAGLVGQEIVAPMIYKESRTSDFFTKWFDKQLLPSLSEPHLIVMDNASFHPKIRLDKLAVAKGHYFFPLPPYSPEINPIEHYWANIKHKVRDLLRTGKSIYESLEYCL